MVSGLPSWYFQTASSGQKVEKKVGKAKKIENWDFFGTTILAKIYIFLSSYTGIAGPNRRICCFILLKQVQLFQNIQIDILVFDQSLEVFLNLNLLIKLLCQLLLPFLVTPLKMSQNQLKKVKNLQFPISGQSPEYRGWSKES